MRFWGKTIKCLLIFMEESKLLVLLAMSLFSPFLSVFGKNKKLKWLIIFTVLNKPRVLMYTVIDMVLKALQPSWLRNRLLKYLVSLLPNVLCYCWLPNLMVCTQSTVWCWNKTEMPGVVSVFPNTKRNLHTTHSWDFMGLSEDETMEIPGFSTKNQVNVIIGFIDTGDHFSVQLAQSCLNCCNLVPVRWKIWLFRWSMAQTKSVPSLIVLSRNH